MPFAYFHAYLPEIGIDETRSLRIPPNAGLLVPADEYGFVEMYCDEPGCDCRRVMFRVRSRNRGRDEAIITWGWETPEFYRKWLKRDDPQTIAGLIGPVLNMGSPTGKTAMGLLELTTDVLLRDADYVERIKRHYATFRQRIDLVG